MKHMKQQTRNRCTDIENKLVVTSREGQDRAMGLRGTSSKDILYSRGNYTHYLVITFNRV